MEEQRVQFVREGKLLGKLYVSIRCRGGGCVGEAGGDTWQRLQRATICAVSLKWLRNESTIGVEGRTYARVPIVLGRPRETACWVHRSWHTCLGRSSLVITHSSEGGDPSQPSYWIQTERFVALEPSCVLTFDIVKKVCRSAQHEGGNRADGDNGTVEI